MARRQTADKKIYPRLGIRKGDTIRVLAGKDKGKDGEVIGVNHKSCKVTVRDINIIRKATRPDPNKNPQGGIVPMPAPMDISNVMLKCPRCGKPSRTTRFADKEGKSSRKCRKCGELIDG